MSGAVAAFDLLATAALDAVLAAPVWGQALAPLVGLTIAALALRYLAGGATPSLADEYIRNFHEPGRRLPLRALPGRLVAALATPGLGGSMGWRFPTRRTWPGGCSCPRAWRRPPAT